jgi:hypothetical protein
MRSERVIEYLVVKPGCSFGSTGGPQFKVFQSSGGTEQIRVQKTTALFSSV